MKNDNIPCKITTRSLSLVILRGAYLNSECGRPVCRVLQWHFVEPLWSSEAAGVGCSAGHRLAWSGWFATPPPPQQDEAVAPAAHDLSTSLGWLRNRLEAYVNVATREEVASARREEDLALRVGSRNQ